MQQLDALDKSLIAALRNNARLPMASLAKTLGVSRATAQNRLDRLVEGGVIQGFTLRTPADAYDAPIRAIMMIEIDGAATQRIVDRLRGLPAVRSIASTNGKWDLVVDLAADTLGNFDRVLGDVRGVSGIRNTETSLLLSNL